MTNPERDFIEQFPICNVDWLRRCGDRIRAYCVIANTLYPRDTVQDIVTWGGPTTENEEYNDLIGKLMAECNVSADGSYDYGEWRGFLIWAVHHIHDRKLNQMEAKQREKLADLERQKKKIETELLMLRSVPTEDPSQ